MRVHEILLDPEVLEEFVDEARGRLQAATREASLLETEPANDNAWDVLKRELHTLKGSAGWVGLDEVSEACYELEDLLGRARDDPSTSGPRIGLLRATVVALGKRLQTIEAAARGNAEYDESETFTALREQVRSA